MMPDPLQRRQRAENAPAASCRSRIVPLTLRSNTAPSSPKKSMSRASSASLILIGSGVRGARLFGIASRVADGSSEVSVVFWVCIAASLPF